MVYLINIDQSFILLYIGRQIDQMVQYIFNAFQ